MSHIKRRHFIQLAASTMATLGLDQANFFRQSEQHGKVLAQPTGRKLALLVGVNKYLGGVSPLKGCLTDVEMQRQLLIHRYGFNPADILIVSDEADNKPTRANILRAFEEHLIKQAKPGDVAIFHFSGHGSRVVDPTPLPDSARKITGEPLSAAERTLNGTLVAANSRSGGNQVDDIMGKTLFLLSRAVQTDNFSMVLDSCHSGGGTRGNLTFRNVEARHGGTEARPSYKELNFQEQWLGKLDLTPQVFQQARIKGIARGMAMGSARENQYAADAPFGDFYAGAFSYLLTRYLWQLPGNESLRQSFDRLALITRDVAESAGLNQDPLSFVAEPRFEKQPIYFLSEKRLSAEAVVQSIHGKKVEFWLGGVSSRNLKSFEQGAKFELIDGKGKSLGEVEQTSRFGLTGYGSLTAGSPQSVGEGTLMREKVRGVPANLSLKVGLDPSLGKDLAAARQALEQMDRIEPVVVDQSQPVDVMLGRLTQEAQNQAQTRNVSITAPQGTVGLLTQNATPVPRSFLGGPDEPVEVTIGRLRPRLKMLLAGQILNELLNGETHNLKVDVGISVREGGAGPQGGINNRSSGEQSFVRQTIDFSKPYKAGTIIDVTVKNNEPDENVYMGIIVVSDDGSLDLLHPVDWQAPEAAALVAKGQDKSVPLQLVGPAGFMELLVLTSTQPLRNTFQAMQGIARSRGLTRGAYLSFNEGTSRSAGESDDTVVDFVNNIVGDVGTRAGAAPLNARTPVNTNSLAALSVMLKVGE